MGQKGAKLSLEDIRRKMNRARTVMRQNVHSAKAVAFCDDPNAFNWACRDYRYNYTAWNGNVDSINNGTYENYFNMIADGPNYRMALESLKDAYESNPDAETRYLLDSMVALRKKYKIR